MAFNRRKWIFEYIDPSILIFIGLFTFAMASIPARADPSRCDQIRNTNGHKLVQDKIINDTANHSKLANRFRALLVMKLNELVNTPVYTPGSPSPTLSPAFHLVDCPERSVLNGEEYSDEVTQTLHELDVLMEIWGSTESPTPTVALSYIAVPVRREFFQRGSIGPAGTFLSVHSLPSKVSAHDDGLGAEIEAIAKIALGMRYWRVGDADSGADQKRIHYGIAKEALCGALFALDRSKEHKFKEWQQVKNFVSDAVKGVVEASSLPKMGGGAYTNHIEGGRECQPQHTP